MTERKKNVLILIIAILVSLAAIEVILRLFEQQNYVALWLINKDGMGIYKPNTDKYFLDNEDYKKYHIKINSLGFLGEDFSEEKASGTLRVVVLGDSFVAATGVDFDKTFPYLLTKKFQDLILANPSSTYNKVEVLNFGMGGMGTVDEMKYYYKYAQKYHPDVVVLSFYLGNDNLDNSYSYNYKDAMLSSKEAWGTFPQYAETQVHDFIKFKDTVYRKSAITRFTDRVVRSSPQLNAFAVKLGLYRSPVKAEYGLVIPFNLYYYIDPPDAERAQYLQFSSDLLNNFKKQMDTDGVKFVAMFIPDGLTVDNNLLNSFKNDHPKLKDLNFNPKGMEDRLIAGLDSSIKILNLRAAMEKNVSENRAMYKHGDGHFTGDGHVVVSDILSDFIFTSFFK